MGDMADHDIEQGENMWFAHCARNCFEDCIYCEDENDYYPGWEQESCGCCNGLEWGGEEPRECSDCNGSGSYWKHIKSGALAMYPGGPFVGKESKT